jgi:GTP-binding protein EngB required for normal cell division
MRIEDRDEFVDKVAQAVIDYIEERDRIAGMVELVARCVMELQKETRDAELARLAQEQEDQQDQIPHEEKHHAGE